MEEFKFVSQNKFMERHNGHKIVDLEEGKVSFFNKGRKIFSSLEGVEAVEVVAYSIGDYLSKYHHKLEDFIWVDYPCSRMVKGYNLGDPAKVGRIFIGDKRFEFLDAVDKWAENEQ